MVLEQVQGPDVCDSWITSEVEVVQTGQVITDGGHHRVVNNIIRTVGELKVDQPTQLPKIVVQNIQ